VVGPKRRWCELILEIRVEEAGRLWAEVDDRDVLLWIQLFGEMVLAKKFEQMVKEIELKMWSTT
jgi:hypothetical protein